MNKLLKILALCLTAVLLTGCFPSDRMHVVEDCRDALCGFMPNKSEFAFVKQASGSNYEIWVNQQPDNPSGPMLVLPDCEAPVSNNKFECDLCGNPNSFRIEKASGSDCTLAKCVTIQMLDTPQCPGGGGGKAGHN